MRIYYLRKETEKYDFPTIGRVTFSAGIYCFSGEDDMKALIDKADTALYFSKKNGRNKITAYSPEMAEIDKTDIVD